MRIGVGHKSTVTGSNLHGALQSHAHNPKKGHDMETMQVFDLRCRDCSWKQLHIVTNEYAQTLRIQHEFRYDQHTVEVVS